MSKVIHVMSDNSSFKALAMPENISMFLESYAWDYPGWWHSQAGQDHLVSTVLQGKTGGFFVDLAANRPVTISNTRALERDFGWQGICIDGSSALARSLAAGRNCTVVQALISSSKGLAAFNEHFGGVAAVHRASGPQCKNCQGVTTLDAVLDEFSAPRIIDYMSIDLEGEEEKALSHFPFGDNRYTVYVMTVERPSKRLTSKLQAVGLRHVLDQGWFGDQLWINERIPGGITSAASRATTNHAKWLSTLKSANWVMNRSGWVRGVAHHRFPFANCGVPQSWISAGAAPPYPSNEFEGLAKRECGQYTEDSP
jgi:hypothetical protein